MPARLSRPWKITALAAAVLLAGAGATAAGDAEVPSDQQTTNPAEPTVQIEQLAERGATTGRVTVTQEAPRSVCRSGASWLRLRFTDLSLRGSDSVTLTGSAGGSLTLTAQNWTGKAFHTRSLRGECVAVTPNLADPASTYTIDAFQAGTQDLEAASVVVAGAGDLCGSACDDTRDVLNTINPAAVFTLGDNAYSDGTDTEFRTKYDPTWGQFKSITFPSPGNHDYETPGAAGYFNYFGSRAGEPGKGYYSWDIGDWHFIALNSNISRDSSSTQVDWLKKDLAANTKPCTAAYWHHARFSRGDHGDNTSVRPFYEALYAAKADLVLVGHDHDYERFAPARPDGAKDLANGVRQLVVGTGGQDLRPFNHSSAGPHEVGNDNTFGVAKLTLRSTGYDHEFKQVKGRTFHDEIFDQKCHKASITPDFGVSVNPSALEIAPGSTGSTTVTVSSLNGFTGPTALSASGLPAGVTHEFTPNPVTPPANGNATATLKLTASATAPNGTSTVTVKGTSGLLEHSASLTLTIGPPGSGGFADDFETDKGWTPNPSGVDTATTGRWERGDPEQTTSTKSNQVKQLGNTVSGTNNLVTGRLAGDVAGTHDVDGGVTSIRSPAFAVPSSAPRLTFAYSVGHDDSGPDDYLRIHVIDGTTVTTVFQKLGSATNTAAAWQNAAVDLASFAGKTVRLQVEAADLGATSLFEAQVDDVRVTSGTPPVFADDFETEKGWTPNPSGVDTATSGRWERGDPEQTANSVGVKQLGTTTSVASCLTTARLAGSSYGANDLDGGGTSIQSPAITLPAGTSTLTFAYNVAHDVNSGPDDYLRIHVVDGTTVTKVFEKLGVPSEVNGSWRTASADLTPFAGKTIQIRIDAADAGAPTLFEAQVDDLTISG